MTTMTREEYMNAVDKAAAHRQYYGQFVSDTVRQVVASRIGRAAILASTDPHFNDIPLKRWDDLYPVLHRAGWSLSDVVCTAKEAARQIKEGSVAERERFAADWGVDIDRVNAFSRLANECKRLNEFATNGDPHPRNRLKRDDKNENANLWTHDLDVLTAELMRNVQTYGFTSVEYTGLRPCLKRGDRFVEIPS